MKIFYSNIARAWVAGGFVCLWTLTASAQTNFSFLFPVNLAIPDGNASGLALKSELTGTGGIITNLTVSLEISGGYNGDLYAYLAGPNGGFAVLLNRVGITAGNAFGYADAGLNLTFDDSTTNSGIHFYQDLAYGLNGTGQLIGNWSSDGRAIDPQSASSLFDLTQSTASLSSFSGTDPNGLWTLFLADLSSGGQSTVVNWGLSIATVPEPATYAVVIFGLALFLAGKRLVPVRGADRTTALGCQRGAMCADSFDKPGAGALGPQAATEGADYNAKELHWDAKKGGLVSV